MAIANHERVGKAMDLLKARLGPLVERELENVYKDQADAEVRRFSSRSRRSFSRPSATDWSCSPGSARASPSPTALTRPPAATGVCAAGRTCPWPTPAHRGRCPPGFGDGCRLRAARHKGLSCVGWSGGVIFAGRHRAAGWWVKASCGSRRSAILNALHMIHSESFISLLMI